MMELPGNWLFAVNMRPIRGAGRQNGSFQFMRIQQEESRSGQRMGTDMKAAEVSRNILPRVQLWSIGEYWDGRTLR